MSTILVQSPVTSDSTKIQSLHPVLPVRSLVHHDGWRPSNRSERDKDPVRLVRNDASGAAWAFLGRDRVFGLARFSMLPWDSAQLRIGAARIDHLVASGSYQEQLAIKESLLSSALREMSVRNVRHVSIRVDASDLSGLHVVEKAGFITVDSLLTFAIDLSKHHRGVPETDFRIRLATAADADTAAALARDAYVYDRFHSDPSISSTLANELHATWIHNSCTGKAADAVLLAEDQSGLLGFVTCSLKREMTLRTSRMSGTIVLVATAAGAGGRGVGYATTMAALLWFRWQGCEHITVGTQLRNIPAARLYQRCGFSLVGSSISLRGLLQKA